MLINPTVKDNFSIYREKFASAKPFKHVVIDNFFTTETAQILLQDFPKFDTKKAISEVGTVGGKAINENLASISKNYQNLNQYLKSKDFLDLISQITGIENLITDPTFYGGGTHENLNGQELDIHVDFNLDERKWHHRRLNLIIFLNEEWQESWGGSIELHSDPRHPELNQISAFTPIFNRCVIFETNEYSWHSFSKIVLPEDKQHLSRKSLSIYLYTKERPESVIPHTTFYIHRPLPEHIKPGMVLSDEDYQEIKTLIKRRDDLIQYYQEREIKESSDLRSLKAHIKRYLAVNHSQLWKLWRVWLGMKKAG